ncbi:MAG: aspartate kinase [Alphaproteobacteria bacterium]|nr:aspartate kinase [Alphaproteobacteria bacterium]
MAVLVLKFGGTSVANPERIQQAAKKVKAEIDLGHKVVVVVSAMSGVTNQLVDYVRSITPSYDPSEYDVVVASGEQVTSGLMALALQQLDVKARSYQGWQLPFYSTDKHEKARIDEIDANVLNDCFAQGITPVVPGFQGVTRPTKEDRGRITTLGRGGSDTSAVALAAALKADRCDIYTDVNGIYTSDPRLVQKARKINRIAYEEMLELASLGSKVLQTRSVELAMNYKVPVQVLSTFDPALGSDLPGTFLVDEDIMMEKQMVTGLAHSRDEARITLTNVADKPGMLARIFGPLADANINVDMIVQAASDDGKTVDVTFTIPRSDIVKTTEALTANKADLGYNELQTSTDVVKISVVGVGMRSHAGVGQMMFKALAEKGINIQVVSTSEIKISVLIDESYTELALRTLHTVYGLDAA